MEGARNRAAALWHHKEAAEMVQASVQGASWV